MKEKKEHPQITQITQILRGVLMSDVTCSILFSLTSSHGVK